MPTVLMVFGLRVIIYPNDHRPAHVHVAGNGCEAVFQLHCLEGQPELRENYGFSKKDLMRVMRELAASLASLCQHWRQIHGNY
ncbi:MAG: DUF4160 domain-containing protein [Pseudomonadota bacterium]